MWKLRMLRKRQCRYTVQAHKDKELRRRTWQIQRQVWPLILAPVAQRGLSVSVFFGLSWKAAMSLLFKWESLLLSTLMKCVLGKYCVTSDHQHRYHLHKISRALLLTSDTCVPVQSDSSILFLLLPFPALSANSSILSSFSHPQTSWGIGLCWH